MKRLVSFIASILFCVTLFAQSTLTYQIKNLNTQTIEIGGKQLKVGDRFKSTSKIKWASNRQVMEAIDSEKKEIHVFSATALKSKKADNVADYLVNINHASTRDLNSLNWTITRSDNSGKFTNRRVALLIANTNYFFRPKLINPMYDCNALSDKLLELGFDVYTAFDCASSQLRDVVIDFSKAADNYDIALFFYSGHGVQDEGQNYLIPVDRPLYNKSDLDYCVKCEFVRNQLDLSKCANRIILFDACRSPNTWARDVSDTWGQMEGSLGTYISFSTKSGKKASDGESGGNSPYTTALLKCISAPNRELTLVMGDVVRETAKITNNQQEPTGTGNFKNELFLNPDSTSSNSQVRVDSDLLVDQANKLCEEKKYAEAFDLYSQAAAQNNVRAINNIGLCYEYGEGVTQNYEKAITYYRDAADKGFAQAYLNLGRCYLEGNGVREDHKEAVEYFIKAEKLDIPEASAMLGACFYDGVGVEQDSGKAFEYFKKAANREVAMAQYFLFICYANGTGVKQSDEQAIIWLKKAASHDYDDANISLGKCYENGLGVERNAIEAAQCYRKAAENDNAQAEYYLGKCYFDGIGVAMDKKQAAEWYKRAADQNHLEAQFQLGMLYLDNNENSKAFEWFRTAAILGSAEAQYELGECYTYSIGCWSNVIEAFKWFKQSAERKYHPAQFKLGLCYYEGNGCDPDYKKAVYWFRQSADQNNSDALCCLGLCFYNGEGVSQDYKQAFDYIQKAADKGSSLALCILGYSYTFGYFHGKDYHKAVNYFWSSYYSDQVRYRWYLNCNGILHNFKNSCLQDLSKLKKAAENANAEAQCLLGYIYIQGYFVDTDYALSFDLFTKSSKQNNAEAQLQLGMFYEHGYTIRDVMLDRTQAYKLYIASANQGNAIAMHRVGWCYHIGLGIETDLEKSLYWYQMAANHGDISGYIALGSLYEYGEGVSRNRDKAAEYYRKAADLGDETAKYCLKRLGK